MDQQLQSLCISEPRRTFRALLNILTETPLGSEDRVGLLEVLSSSSYEIQFNRLRRWVDASPRRALCVWVELTSPSEDDEKNASSLLLAHVFYEEAHATNQELYTQAIAAFSALPGDHVALDPTSSPPDPDALIRWAIKGTAQTEAYLKFHQAHI
jgi:hypothetical protein